MRAHRPCMAREKRVQNRRRPAPGEVETFTREEIEALLGVASRKSPDGEAARVLDQLRKQHDADGEAPAD